VARKRPAVVILHYGRPELTARLRDQLLGSDPEWRDRVLVLDNCAPEPFPGAWERLAGNLYWAGALAWTLERLGREGFSHVWFLNNDILFVSKPPHLSLAWARLAALEERLGPVGLYSPAAERNPYHPQMVARPGAEFRRVALADGIAPLLSLECVRAVGGIDFAGNPQGYGVDVWTSLGISRARWPVVVDHRVVVRHRYHGTARTIPGFMDQAARSEHDFLRSRMGEDYPARLAALKAELEDFELRDLEKG